MEQAASRQFYSLPKATDCQLEFPQNQKLTQPLVLVDLGEGERERSCCDTDSNVRQSQNLQENNLVSYVANNIIGTDKTFSGPFGLRTGVYLDFTASGRSLHFIEDYIQKEVLPEYGNTHTTTSITSLQTTLFRHEARDIIRNSCNASEHDSVIFVGSGTTGAVHKLIHSLHLPDCPIVFVGPQEHHSNILPWMEMGAEVIQISVTESETVDIEQLEHYLSTFKLFGRQMVGAFSAASNVTGVMTDVNAITIALHKHGALAFWDYAAAAPYVKVDMNPYVGGDHQELVYKDAVYFSMHKFVGGVGCPGVLIMKKKLFKNPVPHGCGGGTVFFVRREHHRYLVEPEVKEEGGTPDIVGSIRAGLVFQLREAIGTDIIASQDMKLLRRATKVWQECPELVLLGPDPGTVERLPIVSFMIHHPGTGLFLHHNFVTAVLNDVFGIQARGGCACAGPYAMDILGMPEEVSKRMEELLAEDSRLDRVHLRRIGEYSHREIMRPGFVRINLPYFLNADGIDFVIEAVRLVSQHAWKLLPQYLFNPETGEWRHKTFQTFKDRKWLGHISYTGGRMSYHQPAQIIKGPLPSDPRDCLEKARDIFSQAEKISLKLADQSVMFDEDARPYRWFLLPSEANACLQNKWKGKAASLTELPFCPPSLLESNGYAVRRMGLKPMQTRLDEAVDRIKRRKNLLGDQGMQISEDVHEKVPDDLDSRNSGSKQKNEGSKGTYSQPKEVDICSINFVSALENGFVSDKMSVGDKDCFVENVSVSRHCCDNFAKCDDLGKNNLSPENVDVSLLSNEIHTSLSISQELNGNSDKIDRGVDMFETSKVNSLRKDVNSIEEESKTIPKDDVPSSDSVHMDCQRVEGSNHNNNKNNRSDADTGSKDIAVSKADKGNNWFAPPKAIFKPTVQALEEYAMLQDGDRVLVCLSGGKDSLSLLHTLRQYQFYAKKKGVNFTFGAVTVDPQTPAYDPSSLKRYLAHLRVPYFYESQCIMETATNLPYECASICSFCSRMKRGRIYAAARREGYNVLALGQHLDDLAESFLMSFLHNGSLNTMKAHYIVKEGDLRVIRPFVYVRETELRSFAEQHKLPVISENCPACFEAPKERHRTKQLLAAQEVIFPQVYSSMMAALKPLMARGRKSGVLGRSRREGNGNNDDDDDDLDL